MKVNIYDVAKHAGVSISTVSRVLNGKDRVKDETKEKILNSIKVLGFHPNMNASGLVKDKTNIIGVLLPQFNDLTYTDIYTMGFLNELQKKFTSERYNLMIINQMHNADGSEPEFMRLIHGKKIDGFIAHESMIDEEAISRLKELDFPFVLISESLKENDCNCVNLDFRGITEMAIKHLVEHNHRSIGIVYYDNKESNEKLEIYRELFKKYDLGFDEDVNLINGYGYDYEVREMVTQNIFEHKHTAYFSDCIYYSQMLIYAANILGLSIPDDISILSIEHADNESLTVYPAIDSVHLSGKDVGNHTSRMLLNNMVSTESKEIVEVEKRLIIHGSVKNK